MSMRNPYIGDSVIKWTPQSRQGEGYNIARNMAPVTVHPEWFQGANATKSNGWGFDALDALGSIGKGVTRQFANWTDPNLDWGDIPLAGVVQETGRGIKGQWESWTDDSFNFRDIPLLGGMSVVGDEAPGFDQTLSNLGVRNKDALFWGGLAGDIVTDPTMWLTFGAAAAPKAAATAGRSTAKQLAKDLGVDVGRKAERSIDEIAGTAFTQTYRQSTQAGKTALEALQDGFNHSTTIRDQIQNAQKAAAGRAQNALINIDIPFTNYSKQFGTKPTWAAKKSPKIGNIGSDRVATLLDDVRIPKEEQSSWLKQTYNIDNVGDMNVQQFRHLQDNIKRYNADFGIANHAVNFDSIAARLGKIDPHIADNLGDIIQDSLRSSDALVAAPDVIRQFGKAQAKNLKLGRKTAAVFNKMYDDAAKVMEDQLPKLQPTKYVEGAGGRSKLTDWFANKTKVDQTFNARSFGSLTEGVLNSGAARVQDANNEMYGKIIQAEQDMGQIQKLAKGLTPAEQNAVIYRLEGKAPAGWSDRGVNQEKVVRVAGMMEDMFSRIATSERAAGTLDNVKENYFTHIYDSEKTAAVREKFKDDKHLQRLFSRSAGNRFNQERKSFKTVADIDDYIAELQEEAISTNSPRLQEKIAALSDIINRDPVDVLAQRYFKSVRSTTMKRLFKDLENDGLIGEAPIAGAKFKQVSADDSKIFDIPPNHFVQEDIYDAVVKLDKVFTANGAQALLESAESINSIWKSLVTTIRPVHHVNNLIGNVLNNALAGISFKSYTESGQFMTRMKSGRMTPQDRQLMKELLESGTIHTGRSSDYVRTQRKDRKGALAWTENMLKNQKYLTVFRRVIGENTDNFTRIAHFIDRRPQGVDIAAESVRKFLFNYNETTQGDRLARLLVPFWNFTKRNIPLQLEKLFQQPRFFNVYNKLQEASFEAAGHDYDSQPDFMQRGYFINPLTGNARNPRAPMEDVNSVADPLGLITSSISPFIKAPFEMAANYSFFRDAPIDYERKYGGGFDPEAWMKYIVGQTGIGNDLYNLSQSNTNMFDFFLGKEMEVR